MTTTIVKDSAGLTAALKAAQAGDVIKLAPGTYSPLAISNMKYDGTVTITSLDLNNEAKLTGLNVRGSDGLQFKDLEFVVGGTVANPFQVNGSANIKFDGLNVHGSLDGNPANDIAGMMVRNSKNVTVTNSEFQQLEHGLTHLDNSGLVFSNNSFHDIRTDGIRGGGSSNVTVSGNYFTDFRPNEGDHPDAIQFWTGNTTASASNIVISGNVITRGSGEPVQGIFLRDQVGNLPYQGLVIKGNLVVGGMPNGITIGSGNNVVVDGNVVVGLPDQRSWITTGDGTNVTLTNNVATYYLTDNTTNLIQRNNTLVEPPTDGGKALQQMWLTTHTTFVSSATLDGDAKAVATAMDATRQLIVTLTGTDGADRLSADGVHSMIMNGGAGNDLLTGGGLGHNTMIGGAGDDTYYVKSATDVVVEDVNGGNDQVIASVDYTLTDNVERLTMTTGASYGGGNALSNKIVGTSGSDTIEGFAGDDTLQGQDGNDVLRGGDGADIVQGGAGNDTLDGGAGNDKLQGGDGNDSIAGGAGNDTIEGGAGADTMSGGAGADQFFFREGDLSNTPDVIMDFNRAEGDKISVSMIDANVKVAGDQKFAFIGTEAFHKVAGEARYEVAAGKATVLFDTNGDGLADMKLVVVGVSSLQASDFLL